MPKGRQQAAAREQEPHFHAPEAENCQVQRQDRQPHHLKEPAQEEALADSWGPREVQLIAQGWCKQEVVHICREGQDINMRGGSRRPHHPLGPSASGQGGPVSLILVSQAGQLQQSLAGSPLPECSTPSQSAPRHSTSVGQVRWVGHSAGSHIPIGSLGSRSWNRDSGPSQSCTAHLSKSRHPKRHSNPNPRPLQGCTKERSASATRTFTIPFGLSSAKGEAGQPVFIPTSHAVDSFLQTTVHPRLPHA